MVKIFAALVTALAALALSPLLILGAYALGMIIYIIIAIPFYFLWNWAAPIYFTFLPPVWLALPFWHIVGLFWVFGTVKYIMLPSAKVTNNNSNS